tara:strand:+ start:763 stop:969 length:207 start_codon:yes stop_codon:yes gene_type:complete
MIISKYHAPSLDRETGCQPSVWPGYAQARVNVPIFSANQMNNATNMKPITSGIGLCASSARNQTTQGP